MTTATPSVVFDASAALRAAVDRSAQAQALFAAAARGEIEAAWPDLALLEVAHGSLRLARSGVLSLAEALGITRRFMTAPVDVERVAPLAAFQVAADRNLSVYDATYVVLAESRNAQLVTADRRLADATANSVLIA